MVMRRRDRGHPEWRGAAVPDGRLRYTVKPCQDIARSCNDIRLYLILPG